MTVKYRFNVRQSVPLVYARIKGKQDGQRIKLVFDTGAFMTQLSTAMIEELGYSARDGLYQISASGPSGPIDEGYALRIDQLEVFGKKFQNLLVAVYDFSNLEADGIDGLLGFDVIKQLHLEMNGPKGELIIF